MQINRCPKCGREPRVIRNRDPESFNGIPLIASELECYYCGFRTGKCKTYTEAVAKWNEMTKGINK